jgi:hypothetical protein
MLVGSLLVRVVAPSDGGGRTVSVDVVAGVAPEPEVAPPAPPAAAVESSVPERSPLAADAAEVAPSGASVVAESIAGA